MRPLDHTFLVAATAGDVVAIIPNTTGESLEVLFGEIVYVADATVANRRIRLSLYDPDGNYFMDVRAGAAITAGLTVNLDYMQGIFRETSIVDSALQVPLPVKATIQSGWSMHITSSGGVAGDSYTAKFYAREIRE